METNNLRTDKSKPKFIVTEWNDYFLRLNEPFNKIPEDDKQLFEAMMQKQFPILPVTEKIMEETGIDRDDVDDEFPEREDKVRAFFKCFEVIYAPAQSQQPTIPDSFPDQEEPSVKAPTAQSMTLEEARIFFENPDKQLVPVLDNTIRLKAPVLFENMPVTLNSNFRINCTIAGINHNNVLILDSKSQLVVAVGRIIRKENIDLIIMEKKNIDFESFHNKIQFNLAVLIEQDGMLTGKIYTKKVQIQLSDMEKSDHVLCIDFGTSNTMSGSYRIKDKYGFEPELVEFSDVTQNNRLVSYFPTVVFVEDCKDRNHIKYRFGFEAKALEREGNYESSASVFYQIKHWLIEDSYYPETIDVFDINGNTFEVKKKEIVNEYIRHIISLSEDYFGVKFYELHFTAPVKIKHKFITLLKEMLPEYKIIEDGIDEAGAILFDYVADKFAKYKAGPEKRKTEDRIKSSGNVAVIDCGGGTTDLATCEYRFSKESSGQLNVIEMTTQFTNGDFNYGGNNITFRIMQLVKMKIAAKLGFISEDDINRVLERSENDLLMEADKVKYNTDKLYEDFDKLYETCEECIPTQFNNMSERFFDEDKYKVKRNFYYLWQFADQVKIIFYREEKEVKKDKWDDAIEMIGDLSLNYLYKIEGDELIRLDNPFNLEITITEIRKVIFGDIYSLLNRILNIEDGLPKQVYEYYRLSGQSCKINLFNDLLKEFIPGKRLRALMEITNEHIESLSLKKRCIDGSIRYIMFKRLNMRTELISKYSSAERIYSVHFSDLMGDIPAEIKEEGLSQLKLYPIKDQLTEVMLVIKDSQKTVRRLNLSISDYEPDGSNKDPQVIVNVLKRGTDSIDWEDVRKKLADSLVDEATKSRVWITAVPAVNYDGYGFYIYYIKKIIHGNEQEYRITKGKYYNYEETASGFFDGMR